MSVKLLVATRTDVGRVRPANEDAFVVDDDIQLVAVADGMGGHQAGEVASAMAISALVDGVERGDAIDDAITQANDAVFVRASEDASLRGMGTTITAGVVDGTALVIGHVGDSRAYLFRDGELDQVTTDHSVIAELVAAGELTEAEALVDPRRAMITRALGIDASVAVDVLRLELRSGDRVVLCSDGLTTMVRDETIAEILAVEVDPERAVDALVDAANSAGGADNITVVVADVVGNAESTDEAPAPELLGEDEDSSGDAQDAGNADDTQETPAVATAEALDPAETGDAELEELRAAVEETAPRRWWRRRR